MHIPVLTKEVLEYLDPRSNQDFIDATIGGGGHTKELLQRIQPQGKVLGIDWNENAIMKLQEKFKKEIESRRLELACDNFTNIATIAKRKRFTAVHGVLFDLGLSRDLLEESGLGFSYQKDEPLMMTYHRESVPARPTAEEMVNQYSEDKLTEIFKTFGEERFAQRVAKAIVVARGMAPIKTSRELAHIVVRAIPRKRRGIHPATRVFQALRIAVNHELENLTSTLWQALEVVELGGRVAVISYHSLEDRIVKRTFRETETRGIAIVITKKPVRPQEEEIKGNPSSRSAKLRAIKKLAFLHS